MKRLSLLEVVLAGSFLLFAGCMGGVYKITTSEDGKPGDERIHAFTVQSLEMEDFSVQKMPVCVRFGDVEHGNDMYENGQNGTYTLTHSLNSWLWFFSLGIIPLFESEYVTQDVTVKTPVGEKQGTWRVDAKTWFGWIPLFVGYPESADRRMASSEALNVSPEVLANDAQQRLVDVLAKQFSYDEYQKFVARKKNERHAEVAHIADVRRTIDELCSKNDYERAEALRIKEAVVRVGTWKCDEATWLGIKSDIESRKEASLRKVRTTELARIAKRKDEIAALLRTKDYQSVIAECDKESAASHPGRSPEDEKVWDGLRDQARAGLMEIDRSVELARIAKRKDEITALLRAKDYQSVIAECNKEKLGLHPGMKPEDVKIWYDLIGQANAGLEAIARPAELARITAKEAEVEKFVKIGYFDSALAICDEELGRKYVIGMKNEDRTRWHATRARIMQKRDQKRLGVANRTLRTTTERTTNTIKKEVPKYETVKSLDSIVPNFQGCTELQMKNLVKDYLRKRVSLSNLEVDNVMESPFFNRIIIVWFDTTRVGLPSVCAYMRNEDRDTALKLKKGQSIRRVTGILDDVNTLCIRLTDCDIEF